MEVAGPESRGGMNVKQSRLKNMLVVTATIVLALAWTVGVHAAVAKDMFIVAMDRNITSADPAIAYDQPSGHITYNVYDTLVEYQGGDVSRVHPALAESWEVTPDGKTYTFHIRKGVKFHNGDLLTAEDVRYSFERAATMNKGGAWMISNFVESIDVVDDYTVAIHLIAPFAGYLNVLTYPVHSIMSKNWVEAHGGYGPDEVNTFINENANGTGPFKLNRWEKGNMVVFDRNDDYWREPTPFKRAIVRIIPEPTTRALMLKKGEVDMITLEPINLKEVEGAKNLTVETYPTLTVSWIVMNQAHPALSDVAVRQALLHAFPYEVVHRVVYKGMVQPGSQMLPPGLLGYDPDVKPMGQDLAKAEALLDEAGWVDSDGDGIRDKDGVPLVFEINFPTGNEERQSMGVIFQAELAKIGVKLNVVGLDWPALLGKGEANKHELVITGWHPDFADPDNYMDFNLSSIHPPSMSNISPKNERIDELLVEAREELDPDKREAMYKEITQLAAADATHIYTGITEWINARGDWVKGYEYNPTIGDTNYYGIYK